MEPVPPVAERIEDLSPAWLSQTLGFEVRSATAERVGTGQTGTTYRLTLDADGGPATLVAKLASVDESARRRVAVGYQREVGFYAHLVDTVDVRTPRCWYAAIADDGIAFTLLLDDLAPLVPGVQADGCSVAQATDAVANLAALHAPRWGDESLFDLDFVDRPTEAGAAFLGDVTRSATDEFVRRYRAELDPADVGTLRAVAEAIAEWQMARLEPFAVVHGDYRLDNLLFPPEGDGVVAVDWQTLAVAPPGRDLAYFLGTSLRVEDRRAAERDLVASYHAALVARGVSGYDEGRCFDDYRLGQLQGPMITTLGCAYASGEKGESADRMFLAMARRSCAAIRDLDSLEAL
jgi:phosphotransferase family enzyme